MTDQSTHFFWIWIVALSVTVPGASLPARESATGSASELSLAAAIQAALSRNPRLQATASRVEAAQGRAYQAKLWSNPELELGVEEWSTERDEGFSDSKQTLGIVQELPFPGKKSLDGKIARADVDFRHAELSLRRLELVRDVKAAYFQVLAAERFVAVANGLVDVARSSADAARHRVEAGATSDQEQLRAEIQLEQAKTDLVDLERDLVSARQLFAAILGRTDWENARLTDALADSPHPELLRQNPRAWLAEHPSMTAALAARDRAQLAVRRAGLEPYPNVKVGAAGGRIGASDESIVEFRLSLPLPIIDRAKGRKAEVRAELAAAEAEVAEIELALRRDWRRADQRYRAALAQVESYRDRILPKSAQALELVQGGFEQGKFGLIDLLDTQRTAAKARLEYQRKLLELNVAQAELEALVAAAPSAE